MSVGSACRRSWPLVVVLGLLSSSTAPTVLTGCASEGSTCGPSTGVVARVIDGDTIELETGEKIRYLLVNAPETTGGKNECYGQNASQFNSDLVLGKTVELRYDSVCTDRFGRLLAYVSVAGAEVNTTLVERGYVCVLHIPPDGDARAAEFKALEAAAKQQLRGLWGACSPIPCN
ncbi:MAG: thermonuclease family protein [Kofleriaceae bacterium]|nr:thermonuclease family protein [Kofleriaceae bacterium]